MKETRPRLGRRRSCGLWRLDRPLAVLGASGLFRGLQIALEKNGLTSQALDVIVIALPSNVVKDSFDLTEFVLRHQLPGWRARAEMM